MAAELQIQGQGALGLAFETTLGTFVAPTNFIPIRSESLAIVEDKKYRMNIRGIADRTKGTRGPTHVEGEVEFEVTRDNLIYFLYAMRVAIAKTGTTDLTYTFTPAHIAKPSTASGATTRKTLSILVARANIGFGYVGCSVTSLAFSLDDEVLVATVGLMGLDEAVQTIPALSYSASETYGADDVGLSIPTASARTDISDASITIDDGGEVRSRIDASRAPSGIRWGEREVTFTADHDFESRADYDAFRDNTVQSLELLASRSATNDQVKVTVQGTITDSYESNLSSIGDLVAASMEFHGTYNADDVYEIELKTTTSIT